LLQDDCNTCQSHTTLCIPVSGTPETPISFKFQHTILSWASCDHWSGGRSGGISRHLCTQRVPEVCSPCLHFLWGIVSLIRYELHTTVTGFVISAILLEENSKGKMLTGLDGGDELTTHLFGLGIMQAQSEKETADSKRWRQGIQKVCVGEAGAQLECQTVGLTSLKLD